MINLPPRTPDVYRSQQRWLLPWASLQVRLTLGVVLGTLFISGMVVNWTMWKTERLLLIQHQQVLTALVQQLPEAVSASSREDLSSSLQATIDRLSTPNVWIWFKADNQQADHQQADHQQVLAESAELAASPIRPELLTLTLTAPKPQAIPVTDRIVQLCTSSLKQQGNPIGQFYIAQDVTRDYTVLSRLIQNLKPVSLGAIALLSLFVAWFVRRSLRPLFDLSQAATRNIALPPGELKDVPTEVRALAQAYRQLRDRLSECSLKQEQFSYSLSHELRTPLSLVYGYLQSTLKRCPNLTESQQEALSVALIETENLIRLLQELVEGTRVDRSLLGLRHEPVLINPIVEAAARLVRQFDQRMVFLEAEPAVWAIADADALSRVLSHLLDNAVRYSVADQPIRLRLFQQAERVVIQVCDRGCGIAPVHQSLIFEPLYRVEPSRSRSTGGAGLSLAIARSLTEGMEGTIAVESEPGKGSTFTVTLRRITP